METQAFQRIYTKIDQLTKATCTLRAAGVSYEELALVNGRLAQVVKIIGDEVTLQVFAGTDGIPTDAEVIFYGKPPTLRVSDELGGRFFNAYGKPIDGGPEIDGEEREIGGPSVNPVRRRQPSELIATGMAGIDLNNTLVTGQKIPFFADPDQPYNQVMAIVAMRAKADKIILGGIGLTNDDYLFFKQVFESAGAMHRIVGFINTTEDPPVERLLVPDMALTAAEYYAIDQNQKVLVLLTDMTLYADALSIVSNRMDQIPSKDSMPGSLYSDLAKLYEKAVQFESGGSITIIAVTTLVGRRHYPRHPRQYGVYHRRTALPAARHRNRQSNRRPVPQPFASAPAGYRQKNAHRPPAGDERRHSPVRRRGQCAHQTGKRLRPNRLRRAHAEFRPRIRRQNTRY